MTKTKLGVSAGLIGFIAYVLGGYSSLWVAALLMIFILLTEQDENLRINVVQATVMSVMFALIYILIGGLGDFARMIQIDDYYLFDNVLKGIVSIVKIIFFLLAAATALSNKVMTVPLITPMVEKHFTNVSE